jgi:hypothetical protein
MKRNGINQDDTKARGRGSTVGGGRRRKDRNNGQ